MLLAVAGVMEDDTGIPDLKMSSPSIWILLAVDDERLRSVDQSLAGGGLDDSSLGKMEHRISVLWR
ncbi:hypothetical protein ACLOJK_022639, partial [Asimina triloba]